MLIFGVVGYCICRERPTHALTPEKHNPICGTRGTSFDACYGEPDDVTCLRCRRKLRKFGPPITDPTTSNEGDTDAESTH